MSPVAAAEQVAFDFQHRQRDRGLGVRAVRRRRQRFRIVGRAPAEMPQPTGVARIELLQWQRELAARFADEFNLAFPTLEFAGLQIGRVRRACEAAGRSPDDLVYSAAFVVCAGKDDADIARRATAIGRSVDELRSNSPLVGTPAEIIDRLGAFAEAGVQRVYLQLLDLCDLDHLEVFARSVMSQA